ncbi:ubiquitin-conjugating enzyme E2 E3-like [Frankliniella occidentalis]|uniref:Ubiquitin-conjugating enzyme E2 E3-like n=1 Tax=Frankliniella occidentalis TaxID=133901 RepID=A0A9C6X3X2_FRAOC|nr:ubiquitin-conjugating enzyme E2 E3-like [Frankliniella occidentalis]
MATMEIPLVDKRLKAELAELKRCPLPFANVEPREDNFRVWDGVLLGPENTPYEGGKFNFKLEFYSDYPNVPPRVTFKTRIYHCNFNSLGQICLSTLKTEENKGTWCSAMGVSSLILSIHQLIGDANFDDPLVSSIRDQYRADPKEHDRIAREWTLRFAPLNG